MPNRSKMAQILLLLVAGCPDASRPQEPPGPDPDPRPFAFAEVSSDPRVGSLVVLDGERSTPAADVTWRLVEAPGPGHAIESPSLRRASLVPLVPGRFVVELSVHAHGDTAVTSASFDATCPPPSVHRGTLFAETVLGDVAPDPCPDHLLPEGLVVRGAGLVIERGVRIEVGAGHGLRVEAGSLVTLGTEDALVQLKSAGPWNGVELVSTPDSQLTGLEVEGAAIRVEGVSTVGFEHVGVGPSDGFGLWLGDGVTVAGWRALRFRGAPASVPLSALGRLRPELDTHATADPHEVRGSAQARPVTVRAAPVPYRLVDPNPVRFQGETLISAGVELEVAAPGLELVFGRFTIEGRADRPVVLRGAQSWRGVHVGYGAQAIFRDVVLIGGGREAWLPSGVPASLTLTSSGTPTRARLERVRIEAPAGAAIWAGPGTEVHCRDLATSGAVLPPCLPPDG